MFYLNNAFRISEHRMNEYLPSIVKKLCQKTHQHTAQKPVNNRFSGLFVEKKPQTTARTRKANIHQALARVEYFLHSEMWARNKKSLPQARMSLAPSAHEVVASRPITTLYPSLYRGYICSFAFFFLGFSSNFVT
ncbi:hypothetical protein [Emticicia sp. 17c]|uniref:hypothetical protein n=1 Tax=Emticicia sp. 17c TaxID=3127704 RepID=UPI00301B793E